MLHYSSLVIASIASDKRSSLLRHSLVTRKMKSCEHGSWSQNVVNLRRRRRRRKESTVQPRRPRREAGGSGRRGRRVGFAGLGEGSELELGSRRAGARRLPRRRRLGRDGRNKGRRRSDERRAYCFVADQRLVGVVVHRRGVTAVTAVADAAAGTGRGRGRRVWGSVEIWLSLFLEGDWKEEERERKK